MPQLDPISYSSQMFWLLVSFLMLYSIVSFFIAPRIKKVLDKREDIIHTHVDKADEITNNAKKVMLEYQQAIEEAEKNSKYKKEQALKELQEYIKQHEISLQQEISNRYATMAAEIDNQQQLIQKQIGDITSKIAIEVVKAIDINNITANDIVNHLESLQE